MSIIGNYYFLIIILIGFHFWVYSWIQVFQQKKKLFSFAFSFSLLIFFLQSSYFIIWGLPNVLSISMIVFLCAFLINLIFLLILYKKREIYWMLVFSSFVFFLLVLSFLLLETPVSFFAQQANLQKILLIIHIVFFIFTYLIFSLLFANNILFLIRNLQLKKKNIVWNKDLPSLDKIQRNNDFLTNIVFLFFSISIFLSLFLITSQKSIFSLGNWRLGFVVFLWFCYGCFLVGKNVFLLAHSTKTKITILLYLLALFVFFYELKQLI